MKITTLGDVSREIRGYGFNYSIKNFSKQIIVIFVAIIGAGFVFQLKPPFIAFTALFMFLLLPYVYRAQFKFLYEGKRFDDAVLYMTQMISSFKKNQKIILALKDAREVVDDEAGLYISEAIKYLEEGEFEEEIYKEALSIIEEKYGCSRLKSLHDFLIKIETSGGEYEKALDILNDDIEEWAGRTYLYQQDRKNVRGKITLAIALAFVICAATNIMIPEQFAFYGNMVYQIVSTITVSTMCLFYAFVQTKITGKWLDGDKSVDKKQIDRDLDITHNFNVKAKKTKMLPVALIVASASIFFIFKGEYMYAVVAVVGAYVLYTQPDRKLKSARRRIEKEVLKAFPDWLRSISILLQTQTVRVAIKKSLDEAPYILQPYIEELIEKFENDYSVTPYVEFLKEFNIKEVGNAMRSLYSFNKATNEESEQQINSLIKRNNEMLAKSEKIKNEDVTSMYGFMVIMPMVIGCVKMVTDMVLMFGSFIGKMKIM